MLKVIGYGYYGCNQNHRHLVIVVIGATGFWYISGLRADLAVSQENTKKMEAAVELQKQVIEQMQADQKKIQELNQQLVNTVENQKKDMQSLADRFSTNADGSKRETWARLLYKNPQVSKKQSTKEQRTHYVV